MEEPIQRRLPGWILTEVRLYFRTQSRHRFRQLVAPSGRFAQPERNRGRHAMSILDAHYATLDPLNPVALIAKLEDIAGQTFDREILVDCPYKMVFRLDQ